MLTSDFGNYSETESNSLTSDSFNLNSESSDFQGSEIDPPEGHSNERKVKSKSRSRAQKKVKYWTLPTMSSGTFNPSMLTARQQLQYLAQKSKLGEESDSLELSPLRLDRIKFEEMKSMNKEQDHHQSSNNNHNSRNNHTPSHLSSSSPSNKNVSSSKGVRGSKLKEEISSSPTTSRAKVVKQVKEEKTRKLKNEKKPKKVKVSEEVPVVPMSEPNVIDTMANEVQSIAPSVSIDIKSDTTESLTKDVVTTTVTTNVTTTDTKACNDDNNCVPVSNSFFGNVKNFIFDYKSLHRKHFENFLKDFAKRLGLSPDDELVKKKREEIIKKGMI